MTLDELLKPCVELTSLSLTLYTTHGKIFLRQNLANDVSLLISHHPTVKQLVLSGFEDLLVGYWDKYRLPTSIETLELHGSIFTPVDLEHWTNASTTSHIRDLKISTNCFNSPSHIEGYLKVIESHAKTLVSLNIDLSSFAHQPTVDHLKHMAKRLAQFNTLQRFTYYVQNVRDMLEILLNVMPLIAINGSLNSYELFSGGCLLGYDRDFLQSLQLAMKTICVERSRFLDFSALIFDINDDFQDRIPSVEYEDLWDVVGFKCYPRSDYNCDMDEDVD